MRKWPAVLSVVLFAAVATAAGLFPALAADDPALEIALTPRATAAHTGEVVRFDVLVSNPSADPAPGVEVTFGPLGLASIEASGCSPSWDGDVCALGEVPAGEQRSMVLFALVVESGGASVTASVTNGDALGTAEASVETTGRACTHAGTLGDDVIVATSQEDVICAGPGDDRIEARSGDDRILAGGGDDIILLGPGDDRISGDAGRDTIVFDRGRGVVVDLQRGRSRGAGRKRFDSTESISGTRGDDLLLGSPGANTLDGRGGDDTIAGRRGPDVVIGRSGEDDLVGGRGDDRLHGGPGVDTCLKGPALAECERRWRPLPLAGAAGLELFLPGRRIEGVGFHQSLFSSAVAMASRSDGFFVMSSRGRGTHSTSAADVVMRAGAKVLAPVSGKVVSVTPYRLYCGSENDVRILIKPRGRPDVRVMVLHVTGVRVSAGQSVTYAYTALGTPRSFTSFPDQVDGYVPGGHPHVHVEVESPAASPLPGC